MPGIEKGYQPPESELNTQQTFDIRTVKMEKISLKDIKKVQQEVNTAINSLLPEQASQVRYRSLNMIQTVFGPETNPDDRTNLWLKMNEENASMERTDGIELQNLIAASALLQVMQENFPRLEATRLTPTIENLTLDVYERIFERIKKFREEEIRLRSREANILILEQFPAGVIVFEFQTLKGPIPENLQEKYGLSVGDQIIYAHIPTLPPGEHLSEAGYRESLENIAEEMKQHPEIKGYGSGSWLYDPSLGNISPHLAWLQNYSFNAIPLGTLDLHVKLAAQSSKTRARAIEEGKWTPVAHTIFLNREKFIEQFGKKEKL